MARKRYGISLEAFHRIAIMAAGELDTLPHSRAVITLLALPATTVQVVISATKNASHQDWHFIMSFYIQTILL
ncbi:hypothetical protein [Photobacterium alginatilyticum]|uniref:Uncharacterized protein n=1 Tax=Photobacterium alginatilyticum TaxID=1775171 RepID=A0ABW9YJ28_9GAMM|nr:hypothetical protein [Photobacterium alginatilyticum]NBI53842.1 hypothetical protein [Photobacterium alginatilyticum]